MAKQQTVNDDRTFTNIADLKLNTSGKTAHIFAERLEDKAILQFEDALAQPFVVAGALMPDAHMGYSLPIGGVVATRDVIVPAYIGYDLGCGMCAIPTSFSLDAVKKHRVAINAAIRSKVPLGFSHNSKDTVWAEEKNFPRTDAMQTIFDKNGLRQLGTLGGGNHFIEIGADESNQVWVIIHTGSRGIGHATATHYMKLASGDGKAREGHYGLDVNSKVGKDYIVDLAFNLEFALQNRHEIMSRIISAVSQFVAGDADWTRLINRNHNHAELRDGLWIHRKGATHADVGMMGVIPGNMRDGSFIVEGLGNPDALWSSSHGAGRVMGRKVAMATLSLDAFKETMANADILACTSNGTLAESPEAYKDIFEVMRNQSKLVRVVAHVKPILNIKSEDDVE